MIIEETRVSFLHGLIEQSLSLVMNTAITYHTTQTKESLSREPEETSSDLSSGLVSPWDYHSCRKSGLAEVQESLLHTKL